MKYSILEKINIIFFIGILILSSITLLITFFFPSTDYCMIIYSIIALIVIIKPMKSYKKLIILGISSILMILLFGLIFSGYLNPPGLDLSTLFLTSFVDFITNPFLFNNFSLTSSFYSSLLGSMLMFLLPILLLFFYIVQSIKKTNEIH